MSSSKSEFYTSDDLRNKPSQHHPRVVHSSDSQRQRRYSGGRRKIPEPADARSYDDFRNQHMAGGGWEEEEIPKRSKSLNNRNKTPTSSHSSRSDKKHVGHHHDSDSSPCEVCEEKNNKKKHVHKHHHHHSPSPVRTVPLIQKSSARSDLLKHEYFNKYPTGRVSPTESIQTTKSSKSVASVASVDNHQRCGDPNCSICQYMAGFKKGKGGKKDKKKKKRSSSGSSSSSLEIHKPGAHKHHHHSAGKEEICSDPENCELCGWGAKYDKTSVNRQPLNGLPESRASNRKKK